jgi:hypothetical protein
MRCTILVAAACAGLFAAGCGADVSEENYDKVQVGMTLDRVQSILGAGEDQTASGVGISAGGLATASRDPGNSRSYLWKDGPRQIIVDFRDGKVVSKSKRGFE